MSEDQAILRTPESGVSPKSQPTSAQKDYFTHQKKDSGAELPTRPENEVQPVRGQASASMELKSHGKDKEVENDSDASATTPGDTAPSPGSSSEPPSRKMSISSVTFRQPNNPALPQGIKKKPLDAIRRRAASPPHRRFESHVAFDNIPLGEPTEYNPISFTLNSRHDGYQSTRRSRTFMVGVDDNSYSDHALQWLLAELVDDGDEVVCVRVIEQGVRLSHTAYQEAAHSLMNNIQSKNTKNLAIKIVLEYAVGKLHNTFQHLIKMHQPSMLIVGTKGRSLDSVSGLLVNRSSFSKYCLQYSPVPVVVVRPTEKRDKKRAKRANDPTRQSYAHMLSGQKHEADSASSSVFELEPTLTADEEAHRVAMANGLPARYDPTIKPIDPNTFLLGRGSKRRSMLASSASADGIGRLPADADGKGDEVDGSESEYEEEFELTTGEQALKKERLHKMESNEGAALKEMQRKLSAESIEEESDETDGGAKTGAR